MKYSLLCLFCLAMDLFALPCPNGGGILYKDNTIEEVIKQCGPPQEQKKYSQLINENYEWIYYKPHVFDGGFSQLIVSLRNARVVSLFIRERYSYYYCQRGLVQVGTFFTVQTSCGDWTYYTSSTNFCGTPFGIGATQEYVLAACGQPANPNATGSVEITELIYHTNGTQTLIFTNGHLSDWK